MGCNETANNSFQGYIEGDYIYLAPSRTGHIENLLAARGATVAMGMPLLVLEADTERNKLQEAQHELTSVTAKLRDMGKSKHPEEVAMIQAQLNQAKAQANNATALLKRYQRLIQNGGISQQEFDNAQAKAKESAARVVELINQLKVFQLSEREDLINALRATVEAAKVRVAQAKWELAQKFIKMPCNGLIYDILYRPGEWVSAGPPVIQLLPSENVKIRFFLPQTQLGKIQLGERVQVNIDGQQNSFIATISYISANVEYTPPVIYSNETRSKLVFMVEALPNLDIALSLHPGQPVSVSLL